jgi:aryl-alcohol dehydrogenase-like predicted oxidoreductase
MSDIVQSGKATAWGTSEWSAQQITEAVWFAKSIGAEPPMFEQPQYNLYHRDRFEQEYEPMFKAPYNMGTTIWSPLASGLLTGKYNDSIPEGSRVASGIYGFLETQLESWHKEGKIDMVRKLTEFAKEELDCSMAVLALAWCLKVRLL